MGGARWPSQRCSVLLFPLLAGVWAVGQAGLGADGEELRDSCPECESADDGEALTSLLQVSFAQQRAARAASGDGSLDIGGADDAEGSALARPKCQGFECVKRYVSAPDSAYSYVDTGLRLQGNTSGVDWTGSLLNMTSQRWLSNLDTVNPAWSHGVVVIRPSNMEGANSSGTGWATLYVCLGWYGSDHGPGLGELRAEDNDVQVAAAIAVRTGAPAAIVYAVPPQVEVSIDHKIRDEDDLLAHGQLRFFRGGGKSRWLVELPMTKAVVRAMDTVSGYAASAWGVQVHNFTLTGASKRAAASWHAAAVDDRVRAIVPMAKSLDTELFVKRTVQSYGGIPVVGATYMDHELVAAGDESLSKKMWKITDPIMYASRYKHVAKLVIDAAQDEYFMPDHASLWWGRMPGPKSHLVVTDGGHIIGGPAVLSLVEPISAFIRTQQLGQASPALNWTANLSAGRIEAWLPEGAPPPSSVELRQAHTCDGSRRDFRLHNYDVGESCTRCGIQLMTQAPGSPPSPTCRNLAVQWTGAPIEAVEGSGGRRWIAEVTPPQDGRWLAFFLHFEFPGPAPPAPATEALRTTWRLSTEVAVVPNTYPFPYADATPGAARSTRLVLAQA